MQADGLHEDGSLRKLERTAQSISAALPTAAQRVWEAVHPLQAAGHTLYKDNHKALRDVALDKLKIMSAAAGKDAFCLCWH